MVKAIERRDVEMGFMGAKVAHSPEFQALKMLANKIRAAAAAWVRKYLVVASMARGWCIEAIRGMIARVLISRPAQARSQ